MLRETSAARTSSRSTCSAARAARRCPPPKVRESATRTEAAHRHIGAVSLKTSSGLKLRQDKWARGWRRAISAQRRPVRLVLCVAKVTPRHDLGKGKRFPEKI